MSQDDADPDDGGLASLRAAWRTLPDEEPPARGLADLMAAARVKADQMAASPSVAINATETETPPRAPAVEPSPSWWERLLSSLRRPQALAFATLVVVVGGGLFVTSRRDKLEAPSSTVSQEPTMQEAPREIVAPAPEMQPKGADTATEGVVVGGEAKPEAKDAEPVREAKQGTKRPAPKAPTSRRATMTSKSSKAALETDDAVIATGADPTGAMEASGGGGRTGAASADESRARADSTTQAPPPTLDELVEQLRRVTATDNCVAARQIAKQIAERDASFYRAKVAGEPSLSRCL